MKTDFTIKWYDSGLSPQVPGNPAFPHGKDMDISNGVTPSCETLLPYPAKRIGYYLVTCNKCRQAVMLTTAGRPDDPRSFKMDCKTK